VHGDVADDAQKPHAGQSREQNHEGQPTGGGVIDGVVRVARSPYLLAICLSLFLGQLCATHIYLQQATIVGDAIPDSAGRTKLFADMNSGRKRILIGSSKNMGTGVNAQNFLRAMHHLDAPWTPGELEQRNGRGHRQGNRWNTVLEYRYISAKLDGGSLTDEHKLVLAYLIKSDWANEQLGYTILLTPDNNHFTALGILEKSGLISKHALSTAAYPIYVADRVLVQRSYVKELRAEFGAAFDDLDETAKAALGVAYRHNHFCKAKPVSAKQAAFALWYERSGPAGDIKQFDTFYRKVRNTFNQVQKAGFIEKVDGTRGYILRHDFKATHML
jgi:hypothetical protein